MRKRETLSILHRMSYMLCACQGCSRSWKVLWIYALLAVDCWMPKRIPISHNIHYHKLLSADAAETPPSSASPERGRQAVSVMSVTGSFICSTVPGLFRLRPVTLKPTARRPGTQTLSTCRCPEGLGHWQLSNSKFKHPMSKHSKQDKQRLKAATISRDLSRKRVVSQKHEYCRKSRETELHGPATHAVLCGGIERCCSRRTLEDTFRLHPWGDTVLNGQGEEHGLCPWQNVSRMSVQNSWFPGILIYASYHTFGDMYSRSSEANVWMWERLCYPVIHDVCWKWLKNIEDAGGKDWGRRLNMWETIGATACEEAIFAATVQAGARYHLEWYLATSLCMSKFEVFWWLRSCLMSIRLSSRCCMSWMFRCKYWDANASV